MRGTIEFFGRCNALGGDWNPRRLPERCRFQRLFGSNSRNELIVSDLLCPMALKLGHRDW